MVFTAFYAGSRVIDAVNFEISDWRLAVGDHFLENTDILSTAVSCSFSQPCCLHANTAGFLFTLPVAARKPHPLPPTLQAFSRQPHQRLWATSPHFLQR